MPKESKPKTPHAGSRRRGRNGGAVDERMARPRTHDEIAARAYFHFLERGAQHGDDLSDWFRAEAELRGAQEANAAELQPTG